MTSSVKAALHERVFSYLKLKQKVLTFVGWDKHTIDVAGLLMEEGTVWLLAPSSLVLPIARNLLPVFLFG